MIPSPGPRSFSVSGPVVVCGRPPSSSFLSLVVYGTTKGLLVSLRGLLVRDLEPWDGRPKPEDGGRVVQVGRGSFCRGVWVSRLPSVLEEGLDLQKGPSL